MKGVEESIANFSRLGRVGMRQTDREIILMMTEKDRNREETRSK